MYVGPSAWVADLKSVVSGFDSRNMHLVYYSNKCFSSMAEHQTLNLTEKVQILQTSNMYTASVYLMALKPHWEGVVI